jgi:hypothetical protein
VRIRIAYAQAEVWYDDGVKRPTPEHVDDLLVRLERALQRTWEGKTLEPADLSEYEQGDG